MKLYVHMKRVVPVVIALFVSLAAGAGAGATDTRPGGTLEAVSQTVQIKRGAPAAIDPQADLARRQAQLLEGVWWNDETVVEAVGLKAEQRKKMDELMTGALEAQRAAQREQMERRKQFAAALEAGDWDAARTAAAELSTGVARAWGVQNDLKIDVMSLLDAQQRQTLLNKYPRLIHGPWTGGVRAAGAPQPGGAARRKRAGQPKGSQ